jgi:hypothetical protein
MGIDRLIKVIFITFNQPLNLFYNEPKIAANCLQAFIHFLSFISIRLAPGSNDYHRCRRKHRRWKTCCVNSLAINARLSIVNPIATDTAGNIYLTDVQRIRKIEKATGIIYTIAGAGPAGYSGDGGPAINAQLAGPKSVITDWAGNVYVADSNNNVIRKVTAATGIITTVAGTGAMGSGSDGGPATAAQLLHSFSNYGRSNRQPVPG